MIAATPNRRMSIANTLEVTIAVEDHGGTVAGHELDAFLNSSGIELIPVDENQLTAVRRAWKRFGKGNHPESLDFGDCFAVALADITGDLLLFKCALSFHTDVTAALSTEKQRT